MQLLMRLLVTFAVTILLVSDAAQAAEWPKSVNVAGFTITDIDGRLAGDGSGNGTGKLKIPGGNALLVTLVRNSSGMVRASSSQKFTIGGASVEGSSELDGGGFKGSGLINAGGQSIRNAGYRLSPQGVLSGSGLVQVGNQTVSTSFNISGGKLTVNGAAAKQSTASTPLALYTFKGELRVGVTSNALSAIASGIVERRGKVGNSVDVFGPVSSAVNTHSGQTNFNVAGVNVNFRF